MASGFFALLDDIAAIAKVAASSLDDVATQTLQASKKAAGIVIDDAAVTPRYVVGFAAQRELPIIAKIAWGSLKNKLIYLLPAAVLLSLFAPWAITPLLMAGGAFLCFEGFEKAHHLMHPLPQAGGADSMPADMSEDQKVANAIRTDFILSAEIMAITLASVGSPSVWRTAITLGLVGALVTVAVYGVVALIVKADDFGLLLAQKGRLAATRSFGRGLVHSMPMVLSALSLIGMAAMLWVGGGILLHGLESYGLGALAHGIHGAAQTVGGTLGAIGGVVTWLIEASIAGMFGLAIGWVIAQIVARVAPANA